MIALTRRNDRVLFPFHDDVIKWKHFPRYRPFEWGIHRSPVNSPHNGQWRGALMCPLSAPEQWLLAWHALKSFAFFMLIAHSVYLPLVVVARGRILLATSHHYQTGALCVVRHTWKRDNQELDSPLKIKTTVATQANSPRKLFRMKFVHFMLFYMIMLMKLVDHQLATSHWLNQWKPN